MKKKIGLFGILALCFSIASCSNSSGGGLFPGFSGGGGNNNSPSQVRPDSSNVSNQEYQVTIEQPDHAIIVSDKSQAKENEIVTFTILPDSGYQLSRIYVNGTNYTSRVQNYNLQVSMIKGGITITAYFINPYQSSSSSSEPSSQGSSSYHAHKWSDYGYDTGSPCTAYYVYQECIICGETRTRSVSPRGHDYDPGVVSIEPTCTGYGEIVYTCTVCGEESYRQLSPLGHYFEYTYIGRSPTCENYGWEYGYCARCGAYGEHELYPTGHNWYNEYYISEPTCTESGIVRHTCYNCGQTRDDAVNPLGHDLKLVEISGSSTYGKASVSLYKCKRCEITSLSFKANEVSADSESHVKFTDPDGNGDIGVRFWGRPIGNALALDDDGDSYNQLPNECIYSTSETGDFIEYVFDLTANQAKEFQNCQLYCDAKPADYMNGADFFMKDSSQEEWDSGYYIDGSDEHIEKDVYGQPIMVKDHARATKAYYEGEELDTLVPLGKRIEDYRYLLYVDGEYKEFDSSITNPTHGNGINTIREEFLLPYTFNLHEGTNSLCLRMAGGYKATFWNFSFRPYQEVEPVHVHTYAEEKTKTIETEGCTPVDVFDCVDGDASVLRWEAKAYDTTLSNAIEAPASNGSIRFDHAQGSKGEDDKGGHLVYLINSPVAVEKAGLDFYIQAHTQNVAIFDAIANDSGAGRDVDAFGKYTVEPTKRYALYVNDTRVEIGEDPGASTAKDWFTWPVSFSLKEGINKIEVVCLGGYRAKMFNFQLTGLPTIPVKTWSSEDIKNGLSGSLTERDFNNSLPGVKGYKFNKSNVNCTLTVNMETAGTFNFEILFSVKNGNQARTGFWYQVDSTSSPLPAKSKITVNDTDVIPPENDIDFTDCTTVSDQIDNGTLMVPQWKTVCQVSLYAGENTIVISYIDGGYSYYLCGARLLQ